MRRRYARSMLRFWRDYRPLADDWLLVDNGGGSFVRVASGDAQAAVVYDEEVWWRFQEIGADIEDGEDMDGAATITRRGRRRSCAWGTGR